MKNRLALLLFLLIAVFALWISAPQKPRQAGVSVMGVVAPSSVSATPPAVSRARLMFVDFFSGL